MRNDFDAGKSITRAIVRALNVETFMGPEIASSSQASAISGPKKVEIFRALKWPITRRKRNRFEKFFRMTLV